MGNSGKYDQSVVGGRPRPETNTNSKRELMVLAEREFCKELINPKFIRRTLKTTDKKKWKHLKITRLKCWNTKQPRMDSALYGEKLTQYKSRTGQKRWSAHEHYREQHLNWTGSLQWCATHYGPNSKANLTDQRAKNRRKVNTKNGNYCAKTSPSKAGKTTVTLLSSKKWSWFPHTVTSESGKAIRKSDVYSETESLPETTEEMANSQVIRLAGIHVGHREKEVETSTPQGVWKVHA